MSLPDPVESRAILIGVSKFDHLAQLPAVENNLTAMREILLAPDLCGLLAENCTVVHNPSSPIELIHPIRQAAEKAKDMLLVYYAGHGFPDPTGRDLTLSVTSSDGINAYLAADYRHIRELLRTCTARRRIVILDCCFSGLALNHMGSDSTPAIQLANVATQSGTYLMAAASENGLADAGDEYTTFSGQLIKLVREGIPEEANLLNLETLFNHLAATLRENTATSPQQRESDHGGKSPLFKNRSYSRSIPPMVQGGRYGDLEGVTVGQLFMSRRELYDSGVHRQLQAGICGTAKRGGAESIVVSGGYKDDEDLGDILFYTGHGGRDPNTGVQVRDQALGDPGNAALVTNMATGMPVRVVRGAGGKSRFSPEVGYRYDGLFVVTNYWTTLGADGFQVIRFRLEKFNKPRRGSHTYLNPGRWSPADDDGVYTDRSLAAELKDIYNYSCQVCSTTLQLPGGLRLAETVHIRDIEAPHRGSDTLANMLCLCPNHYNLFRFGAIVIDANFAVIDQVTGESIGPLLVKHSIDRESLAYHRKRHMLGGH
ncbi:hypothetical protein HCN51_30270 [Nonomuraea sp. FMUSA5-5]|uniref:YDG domain-containing protein n=1 Tax=Nonomuraea composti TaxID=2720023 RepID=A0ABX1BD66_9ACTN|nr:YDG/SRA domain-containing protein [Nonomuraea sp. FMUSA5-5]NJP93679.1 hypothetical protein [Nonomuraea sp. FMUSA5-5]